LVNSDVALFEASRSMEAGVLIRDHQGGFLVACREKLEVYPAPEYAEALDLHRVFSLARDEGFNKVLFAYDSPSLA
jgi:hypothetical protein